MYKSKTGLSMEIYQIFVDIGFNLKSYIYPMKTTLFFAGKNYYADLNHPIDISLPLRPGEQNVIAWYLEPAKIEPVVMGDWIGDTNQGSPVNFKNIYFNPHGHGTHTECAGHISKEFFSINQELKKFFSIAKLITVNPEQRGDDFVITLSQLKSLLGEDIPEAVVIRTLPNEKEKTIKHYSNTNPPYIEETAALYLREKNVLHLLIDLPSVDPEQDHGKLAAHKAFWNYPESPRLKATITEFIYADNSVHDGLYLLNLMIAPFENDASPSKPVLYSLQEN